MLYNEVTKENLNKMVVKFYATVLKDELVAPFFIEKLGDNFSTFLWKTHIELLTSFWASIALGDTTYKGNPFAPHLRLDGLKRETFNQWLKLFFETIETVYEPKITDIFKRRSTFMANNFMRNLRI